MVIWRLVKIKGIGTTEKVEMLDQHHNLNELYALRDIMQAKHLGHLSQVRYAVRPVQELNANKAKA